MFEFNATHFDELCRCDPVRERIERARDAAAGGDETVLDAAAGGDRRRRGRLVVDRRFRLADRGHHRRFALLIWARSPRARR